MYCSKCGGEIAENQAFCSRCGSSGNKFAAEARETAELLRYRSSIRRLSRYFYFLAGLSTVLGIMGLLAVQTGLSTHTGPWEPWPHPYIWNWTLMGSTAWLLLVLRVVAAGAAGWGLNRLTDWSRPVALIAAATAFLEFPIGFALAVYALSVLLGRHHASLYGRLTAPEPKLVAR